MVSSKAIIGIVVIIVIILAAVYFLSGTTSAPSTTVNQATSVAAGSSSSPTSVAATTVALSNSTVTTTVTPNATSSGQLTCTAFTGYTCSNVSYSISSNTGNVSAIYATMSQDTGANWSGYGLGFAPSGAKINNGVPEIQFIVSSNATKTNVGQPLQNNQVVRVQLYNGVNSTGIQKINGTVWACYITSGTLYVGNGCTSSGSAISPQYVQVATIH